MAEGSGRFTHPDRRNFFIIARSSEGWLFQALNLKLAAIVRLFVIIIFTSLFFSCATPSLLPPDISTGKKILLPFRIDSITVVYRRQDTVTWDMKLPVF